MWCFKAFTVVRDYMGANLGLQGRAAQKTWVRSLQKPDATQPISRQKLVFMKSHDPNNLAQRNWWDLPWFQVLTFWPHQQRLAPLNAALIEDALCA